MKALHTVAEVAAHFGLTEDQVVRRCSDRLGGWPHLRPDATKSSTWRFTDADVEAIEARLAQRPAAADTWGRTGKKSA